ncbi:MAG: hypothetical protein LJE69_18745 [Thiohalocapsa sp.]|jgi:NCS2 family nucleobase:cation symporter-2|uniref:uracil-xanthine permease family protein n=1 Tax=Thiohalocapsa sp. TaxID=2497641 RepID=UPI0025F9BB35|nr:solute carrier family 23 protein [Thiohalocapsa sp.]MCG6943275.1 hypothetical protein [Thiohalocapsa sp.]
MAERPPELAYGLDERPPFTQALLVAIQHTALICPTLVLIAIVVHATGGSPHDAQRTMALGLVAIAIMTALQAIRLPRVGSGFLLPPVVTATYLPAGLAAASIGGLPLVAGMTIVAGAFQVLFAQAIGLLRKVFPAVVSGVILMAVGMELCRIGMGVVFDSSLIAEHRFGNVTATALATLGPIVALAVWGRGLFKLLCVLIGIAMGYGVAALLGVFTAADLADIAKVPPIALPSFRGLSFAFSSDVLLAFLVAALANGLRTVGVLTTLEQLNDPAWRHPSQPRLRAGVGADGLGCMVCGLLGSPASAASPSLVGLEKTTGVTSRVVAWYLVVLLLVLACLPMLTLFIAHMPRPVMGAVLFFNGAMMFVAGIQVASSRPMTLRSMIIIGFSTMLAVGVLVFPSFFTILPPAIRQLTGTAMAMALISATLLNLVFMLGRWRYGDIAVQDGLPGETIDTFLRRQADGWKLPKLEIERVVGVVRDLLAQIQPNRRDGSEIAVRAGFDDFDVRIQLSYQGALPSLASQHCNCGDLVEEQGFADGLSGYLSGVAADRVDTRSSGEQCEVVLSFRV